MSLGMFELILAVVDMLTLMSFYLHDSGSNCQRFATCSFCILILILFNNLLFSSDFRYVVRHY